MVDDKDDAGKAFYRHDGFQCRGARRAPTEPGACVRPVLANYADLRKVADNLASRGLSADDLNDICIGNYARVLKQAMSV